MIRLRLTEADLKTLKSPLGELLPGGPEETIPRLRHLLEKSKPPFLAAVGDIVSKETMAAHITVNLRIVDRQSMRRPISPSVFRAETVYRVRNPAGVITMESWETIKRAMKSVDSVIQVEGEEDLLVLPCILESADGAIVVYGQPSEGMVVVTVTPALKRRVASMFQRASKEQEND